jgi:hypothetical protein
MGSLVRVQAGEQRRTSVRLFSLLLLEVIKDNQQIEMYKSIQIDRENLTIMGVPFSDLATLEGVSQAIGSNMFEGFVPTQKSVEIIRDYILGKISVEELIQITKAEFHG